MTYYETVFFTSVIHRNQGQRVLHVPFLCCITTDSQPHKDETLLLLKIIIFKRKQTLLFTKLSHFHTIVSKCQNFAIVFLLQLHWDWDPERWIWRTNALTHENDDMFSENVHFHLLIWSGGGGYWFIRKKNHFKLNTMNCGNEQ